MANIYKDGSNELHELLTRAGVNADANLLIPDLQRPYVWTPNQVSLLIDSLIRGWPFGTLLMWKVHHTELGTIPSRAFWNIVDRIDTQNGSAVTQTNPPSEYHMVLDGQQRVQSLLLAFGGDDWGFKLEDREWTEALKGEALRGRQPKYKHWSKASLFFDLDTFAEVYRASGDNLLTVDFSKVLMWAIADPNSGQSNYPKPDNYVNPVPKAEQHRHVRLSRLWAATKPDASLLEKHFKISLTKLLNEHGVPQEKITQLLTPLAELMSTLRDVKLAKVTYLELQQFNDDIWNRDDYNDAIVNIFTRLNTAGRVLTREEITLAWLKVGWDVAQTAGQTAGDCFINLRKELTENGLALKMDELVSAISLMWSVVDGDGKLLTSADLLKGTVIRPMASALSAKWNEVRAACLDGGRTIADFSYEYGLRGQFSSSYALSIFFGWLYLKETWQASNSMTVPKKDDFGKKCSSTIRSNLDRWLICSQWAGVWAQSSGSVITNYVKKLHDTWTQMAAVEDPTEAHKLWAECFCDLVQGFEEDASSYVNSFSVIDRARVSAYRNLLWIWHRLDAERWDMSKVQLRFGKKGALGQEVDHTVSFAVWEKRLEAGLPEGFTDTKEAVAVANKLGNCALLEKNFNVSKSAKSMKTFLEQIHEFRTKTLSLSGWAKALEMSDMLIDPEQATVNDIAKAIAVRDKRIREELIEFVKGKRTRKDI